MSLFTYVFFRSHNQPLDSRCDLVTYFQILFDYLVNCVFLRAPN